MHSKTRTWIVAGVAGMASITIIHTALTGETKTVNKTQLTQAEVNDAQAWRRPDEAQLKRTLSEEQYRVTRKNGTEPPFRNAYWDNHREGIYVDVVSGEPLFGSREKFDSGTGWPSFSAPLQPANIVEKSDRIWLMERIEVRSRKADSHLGHVFDDGPSPGGLRYCINSAALRFVPVEDLERQGYGEYLRLFEH